MARQPIGGSVRGRDAELLSRGSWYGWRRPNVGPRVGLWDPHVAAAFRVEVDGGGNVRSMADKSSAALAVSIAAVLVSGASAVFTALNASAGVTNTGLTAGGQCIAWQEWVVHRFDDGMTDNFIAALTYRAVQSSAVSLDVGISPSPTSAASSAAVSKTETYAPCGLTELSDIDLFVRAIRAGVTRSTLTPSSTRTTSATPTTGRIRSSRPSEHHS